jgi:pimeloyl-ACP methyl ester carboxylesterase
MYVQLARRMSDLGFPTLRIDQSGKGDSDRRRGMSYAEAVERDFSDACEFLGNTVGVRRFILLGLCSGADDALQLCAGRDDIVGAVLLEPYSPRTLKFVVRHFGARVLRWKIWLLWLRRALRRMIVGLESPGSARRPRGSRQDMTVLRESMSRADMVAKFHFALDGGASLLCVFSSGARRRYNYHGQLVECLGADRAAGRITELYLPWAKHTYPVTAHREQMMSAVCDWLRNRFSARS